MALLHEDEVTKVVLRPLRRDQDLADASELVLLGGPYRSPEQAAEAGEGWRDRLAQVFACVGMGADFGDRTASGGMVDSELAAMAAVAGRPVRNETHGLVTFHGDEVPPFVAVSGDVTVGIREDLLRLALDSAELQSRVPDQVRLAFDLYSLSQLQTGRTRVSSC